PAFPPQPDDGRRRRRRDARPRALPPRCPRRGRQLAPTPAVPTTSSRRSPSSFSFFPCVPPRCHPQIERAGARRGRAAACHARRPRRRAARRRRGAAGPGASGSCLAAARATGGEAMALPHGRPELWWCPASPVTISTGGGGPSVGRPADVPARKRCSPLHTRPRALLPHTLQETRPECRSLLTQASPASSLCHPRHRRQATPAAGPDLFQLLGMPWAPTSIPIQHTVVQVTQPACWGGWRRRSASLFLAPASLWHEASPIQSPVAHECHVHGGCRSGV
ncbi:unnamed protein product, partial [Urochloa humidicola]